MSYDFRARISNMPINYHNYPHNLWLVFILHPLFRIFLVVIFSVKHFAHSLYYQHIQPNCWNETVFWFLFVSINQYFSITPQILDLGIPKNLDIFRTFCPRIHRIASHCVASMPSDFDGGGETLHCRHFDGGTGPICHPKMGWFSLIYPLAMTNITMENHHL